MSAEKVVLPCPYPGCDGVFRSRLYRIARYKLRRHAVRHHDLDPDAGAGASIGPEGDGSGRGAEVRSGAD